MCCCIRIDNLQLTVPLSENRYLCTCMCIAVTAKLIVPHLSKACLSSTARTMYVKLLLCHLIEVVTTRPLAIPTLFRRATSLPSTQPLLQPHGRPKPEGQPNKVEPKGLLAFVGAPMVAQSGAFFVSPCLSISLSPRGDLELCFYNKNVYVLEHNWRHPLILRMEINTGRSGTELVQWLNSV